MQQIHIEEVTNAEASYVEERNDTAAEFSFHQDFLRAEEAGQHMPPPPPFKFEIDLLELQGSWGKRHLTSFKEDGSKEQSSQDFLNGNEMYGRENRGHLQEAGVW